MDNSENSPDSLFHYTTIETLLKLFEGIKEINGEKYFVFHASSVDYMNDSMEYQAVLNMCKTDVEEIEISTIKGEPYALSFSECDDSIPMWSMYSNFGKGVCFQFKFSALMDHFKEHYKDSSFKKCFYEKIEKQNEDKPFSPNDGETIHKIKNWDDELEDAAFFKDISFKNESEWRLMRWDSYLTQEHAIKFKSSSYVIVPYMEVIVPTNSLEKIILGRCADERNIESIKRLKLNTDKYLNFEIQKSTVTLKLK